MRLQAKTNVAKNVHKGLSCFHFTEQYDDKSEENPF
jgi:hypothetical protein